MENDLDALVAAYVAAGGTACMTPGGMRRIEALDTPEARFVWDTQIQSLFETPQLYDLLRRLPILAAEQQKHEGFPLASEDGAGANFT